MKLSIAEDDASLRHTLREILQKNRYAAESVENGRDALAYLLSGRFDANSLDVMMP